MRALYRFELKKLFSRRVYWLSLGVMLLVLTANELFPVFTGNYASGLVRDRALDGTAVDDAFLAELKASDDPRAYGPLYDFVLLSAQQQDFSDLDEKTLYEKRLAEIDREMDENRITDGEKAYWHAENARVETPYTFTYSGACTAFFDSTYFINFMVLILSGIALAGSFADERTLGTDQLIFCSRLGRRKLCRAKLAAGLTVNALSTLTLLAFETLLAIILYGTGGFDAMLQTYLPPALYDISLGEACLVLAFLLLVTGLLLGMLTMTLSLVTQNHSASMALMIVLMFLSMINPPASLRVLTQLWNLMPGTFCGAWSFYDYHLFGFNGHYLNCLEAAPLLYLLTGAALWRLGERVYMRCEANGK